ncbi:S-layer homology domain-containing protein, partial [Paenibacillus pini]|uniref:S-layer homology domain-containing protein n=1 Tax=Paenibacillus pini TaxID=669461 RepID=UPI000A7D6F7B
MNKNVRNTITGLIGLSLTLGSAGAVGAASVSDLAGHWAEKQMQEWIGKGDLNGYTDGSVKPNKSITRSEFIALVNRMFKNTETTPIHFADLPETNWAYTDISKAIKAGYLQGYENNTIRPNANVTRQEAASIISKVVGLKSGDLQSLNQYKDASQISAWSKDSVAAVVEKDIMKGYQDGTFAPQKILTRAEAVVLIDAALNKKKLMETVTYDKSGVYGSTQETKIIEGNVVISVPGVSLENVEIKGDLLLAEGIGSGDVTLKNVKVHGTTNVQGGGENSIHFVDSVLVNIVIDKKDGTVRIVAEGTTTAKTVVVKSAAKVEESNVSGVGFTDVELSKELPANAKVVLNGTFDEVDVFAASITVQLTRGSIDSFHVEGTAQNSSIQLSSEAKIINLVLDAVAKLLGSGQIQKAQINDGAKGSTFEKKPDTVEGSAKDSVVVSTPVAPSTPSTGSSSGGSSSGGSTGGGGTTSPTPDVDQQEANKVSSLITALSAIDKLTLADENDVYKTNEAFKALSIKQQALVSEANQTKLTDAVAKIAELKAAAERDQAAADAVTAKIVALPEEITLKNEEEVAAAQAAYEDLTAEQ